MFYLFHLNVQTQADNIAFVLSNKETVTWKQADNIVDAWAQYLYSLEIRQGDRIAVLTKNEDLYLFIHLALDKLNATIVPLDTETPIEQFKHLSFIKTILIDTALSELLVDINMAIIPINQAHISPPQPHCSTSTIILPLVERDPTIANYIVASSGVTHNKKWIPITSAGLLYWADIEKSLLQLSPKDKVLCTRSPAYDARISEYVRAFAAGGTLVLLPQEARRELHEIIRQCELERITCLILIASQLNTPDQEALIQRLALAGLKHLMVTGDACTLSLKQYCEKYAIQLWNCYGPTEATFGMSIGCVNHIDARDEKENPIVPISLPNSDIIRFHLNAKGRLYIESPFLSSGYLLDEEQTQQNFPIMQIDGRQVRVFDTGDKFIQNGPYLIFKGRINNSSHCKVSGVKVEANAIQECLEQYRDSNDRLPFHVYVVIKTWKGSLKPVAYLVVNHEICTLTFAEFLKKRLRKEEMPVFICLDSFPHLSPSNKIDRRALIARADQPEELFFKDTKEQGLVQDALLLHLQRIWVSVLGLERFNNEQEFIFSGGDSLKLNQLYLAIKHEINSEFLYQELIHLPTITLREIHKALIFRTAMSATQALIKPLSMTISGRSNYFFLPPLLGEGYFTYRVMANLFYSYHKYNLYGLTDPSLYGMAPPPASLEEAASRYVRAIQRIQQQGPYNLLGFSFGSTLAYYVAKNLLSSGQQVNTLQIIDGFSPIVYQRLPSQDHAVLLEELINFVIQTLNNSHYKEQLKRVHLSGNFGKSTGAEQIKRIFDYLDSKIINPQSKNLSALARQHLLLAQLAPPPARLPVWTRLYLSDKNQPYLACIQGIAELKGLPTCRLFYYWNLHFDEVIYAYGRDAKTTHLDLLKWSAATFNALGKFWNKSHDLMYDLQVSQRDFLPFYTMSVENQYACRFKIFGLSQKNLGEELPLLKQLMTFNNRSYPLFEHVRAKVYENDIGCSARYGHTFTAQTNRVNDIHSFFSTRKISRVESDKSVFQTVKSNLDLSVSHKVLCISLLILWNRNPLIELSFSCRANPAEVQFILITQLGLQIASESKPEQSMFRFEKSIIDIEHPATSYAMRAIRSLLNDFVLLLEPYSHLSVKYQNERREVSKVNREKMDQLVADIKVGHISDVEYEEAGQIIHSQLKEAYQNQFDFHIILTHTNLSEWYRNKPDGIELDKAIEHAETAIKHILDSHITPGKESFITHNIYFNARMAAVQAYQKKAETEVDPEIAQVFRDEAIMRAKALQYEHSGAKSGQLESLSALLEQLETSQPSSRVASSSI